jgi:hypothetical protein
MITDIVCGLGVTAAAVFIWLGFVYVAIALFWWIVAGMFAGATLCAVFAEYRKENVEKSVEEMIRRAKRQ